MVGEGPEPALERLPRRDQVPRSTGRSGVEVEVAELGDDEAVGREVVERRLDHLRRVQVALGKYEGTGGGSVGGGVAVGCDEPDDVVLVVTAGEECAAVALDVVDVRVLGDVAGVLGELPRAAGRP